MRRSIFKAGVWTAFGLAVAFAIVSANSNTRHAATTVAPAAQATAIPADECTPSDVCCVRETKVNSAAVAAAPSRKAVAEKAETPSTVVGGAAGLVVGIDPESGELTMPSAEQLKELQRAQSQQVVAPAEPVTTVQFPNGAIGTAAASEPEFATIHIDATGRKILGHGELKAPVQPAKPALEEK